MSASTRGGFCGALARNARTRARNEKRRAHRLTVVFTKAGRIFGLNGYIFEASNLGKFREETAESLYL